MDRRAFVTGLGALLAAPRGAGAQQTGKLYRIGYLTSHSATASPPYLEAFRQGLHDLGWIDGQNIVVEYRFAEGHFDQLPALAADLVRLKVDIIAAGPTPAVVAAKNATRTIPIVMVSVGDPVQLGLVESLARPGGNVTGLSYSVGVETFGKGLELLKEAVPQVRRVAILSNPANPAHALVLRNMKALAAPMKVELRLLEARAPNQLDGAFAAMSKERVDALLVVADSLFNLHRTWLADHAAKYRLPSMYGIKENVEAGGLMSYGPNLPEFYRRSAYFVDKILKGTKPADFPIEQPTKFELVINLKTAKALGLTIPPSLLLRADQVIE